MGMFDSVWADCPNCEDGQVEFQSKEGDCLLTQFDISSVPVHIAKDILEDVGCCNNCGKRYGIRVKKVPPINTIALELE